MELHRIILLKAPLEQLIAGKQGPLPGAMLRRLGSMRDNTCRLLRLVNQLLDFTALESGKVPLRFEEVDLRELVESFVEGFRPFGRSKGIKQELGVPPHCRGYTWTPRSWTRCSATWSPTPASSPAPVARWWCGSRQQRTSR